MISLSCGIIILNECNELLLAHATRTSHWDLPKGRPNEGETPVETAIRETMEETSLVFSPSELVDIGQYSYRADKNIHLFAIKVRKEQIDLESLHCVSMVQNNGDPFPEVDRYKWVKIEHIPIYCAKNMIKLLTSFNLSSF